MLGVNPTNGLTFVGRYDTIPRTPPTKLLPPMEAIKMNSSWSQKISLFAHIIVSALSISLPAIFNSFHQNALIQQAMDIRTNAIQQVVLELSNTRRGLEEAVQSENHDLAESHLFYGLDSIITGLEAIETNLQVSNDAFHRAVVRRFKHLAIAFVELAIGVIENNGTWDPDLERIILLILIRMCLIS